MTELLDLMIELYYSITYSTFINKHKPFRKYVEKAIKLNKKEASVYLKQIREHDWDKNIYREGAAYVLFMGKKDFSVYLLNRDFSFIKRLCNIPNESKTRCILVKL